MLRIARSGGGMRQGRLADIGTAPANRWGPSSLIRWTLPGEGAHARIRGVEAGADAAVARFDGAVLNALRETETQTLYRAGNSPYLTARWRRTR